MRIIIFKKMVRYEKGDFPAYSAKLPLKKGGELFCKVKFTKEASDPKSETFPLAIEVKKKDANLTQRDYDLKDPETGLSNLYHENILWVSNWRLSEKPFEDESLNEVDWVD